MRFLPEYHKAPAGLAYISLVFVGLLWILPFLYYRHAYPLTTFYQEWGAAMLGLCAMPLLVTQRFWQQPEIPRIILLPVGLMLLVLVQFMLDKITYFDQTLLFTLYMLWASLLAILGHQLREELGLPTLAMTLAVFLLLGAELSALAGVLQHYRWRTFLDAVVTVKTSAAVYGNLAQPNHFADYITLGLFSLGLLYARWRLRIWQVLLLAAPLLFVLTLSGSRSPWFYLLYMAGMSFMWQRRDKSSLPLLYYSLVLVLGFGLMNLVVQIPWMAGSSGSITAVERMVDEIGSNGAVSSGGIRLHIWHEAWLIFMQFPVWGAGFGQFAWQHFQLGPILNNINITGLYNNAHNLVMQVAAEMGLVGLLMLLGALSLWFWQARNAQHSIYHWWGYGLLAVLGIHSLLEYPLWYAYFLGVAAFILGMLDNTVYRLELRAMGRLSVAAMLLLGVLSLSQLLQSYRNLEGLMDMRAASTTEDRRLREGLVAVQGQPMLRPYAELIMSGMIEQNADHLADKLWLNENVMRFVPIGPVVYREAVLLALAGKQAAAEVQMERAIWSYPGDFPAERGKLRDFALKDPEHFAALLEFAIKKNEEWQRAIHTR